MNTQHWIFLSPHLDDVALSCGGLVWDLTQQGHTLEIWSLMAGLPPDDEESPFAQEIHARWGVSGSEAILARREEDQASCAVLGSVARHFDWPDVIYRREALTGLPIVNSDEELFSRSPEPAVVGGIAELLTQSLPAGAQVVLPMGLGGHVDHQAVVLAGERVVQVTHAYADYPYILNKFDHPLLTSGNWQKVPHHLGEAALKAWQAAVLRHKSQLSTFWRNADETRLALRNYLAGGGGRLWIKSSIDRNPPHR